jgi:hypothetical protein
MQNEVEIMHIWRLPPMGKLVVEVGNRRYEQLSQIAEGDVRQRVTAAIGELIDFAGGYNVLLDAGVAPSPVVAAPTAVAAGPADDDEALRRRQQEFLDSLERDRDALRMAANAPRRRLAIPLVSPKVAHDSSLPPSLKIEDPKISIVEQIDAVLQKYLAAEPALAQRSIHLEQAPEGGLRILIDGRYFQRPGDIEEREIQLALKMALKEWEEEH